MCSGTESGGWLAVKSSQVYQVRLEVFEGPLDLLLQLIQRQEMDITTVALAQVTDQYLDYVSRLEEIDPGALAEFLVIAARLLLIKSRALLPQPPLMVEEDGEDPGEELARRLIEYRKFKAAAVGLRAREEQGLRAYVRLASPPRLDRRVELDGLSLDDLIAAFRQALALHPAPAVSGDIVPFTLTIEDQMREIMNRVAQGGQISFKRFLAAAASRLEVVVSFLALLELIKLKKVAVHQAEPFGEIIIFAGSPGPGVGG